MGDPFVYANPGERRNQSLPGWDQAPLALAQFERIIPPVFNMPTSHRHVGGERAASGVPAVALAVQRACLNLPVTTPAPADHVLEREPAAFSRGGEG